VPSGLVLLGVIFLFGGRPSSPPFHTKSWNGVLPGSKVAAHGSLSTGHLRLAVGHYWLPGRTPSSSLCEMVRGRSLRR